MKLTLKNQIMSIVADVRRLADYALATGIENAELKQKLAEALANDASDAETIAIATQIADEATAEVAKLKSDAETVAADEAIEDATAADEAAQIQAIVDSIVPAEVVEPVAEVEPADEVVVE